MPWRHSHEPERNQETDDEHDTEEVKITAHGDQRYEENKIAKCDKGGLP